MYMHHVYIVLYNTQLYIRICICIYIYTYVQISTDIKYVYSLYIHLNIYTSYIHDIHIYTHQDLKNLCSRYGLWNRRATVVDIYGPVCT